MAGHVKRIPEGYQSVPLSLVIKGAAKAIEFYKNVFGATEEVRMPMPDGRLGHAEIVVGDSGIMLADEHPERGYLGPQARGGTPVSMMLFVEDVATVARRFVQAGGKLLQEVKDQFYGDRS